MGNHPGRECQTMAQQAGLSQKLFEAIFANMTDGVAVIGSDGRIVICNPAMALMVGCPVSEIVGKTAAEAWGAAEIRPLDSSEKTSFEEIISPVSGTPHFVSVRTFGIGGGPAGDMRVHIYRDVTKSKMARRQQIRMDEAYRLLAENVDDGVLIVREDAVVFCNQRFSKLLGYTIVELNGAPAGRLYPEGCQPRRPAADQGPYHHPLRQPREFQCKDGGRLTCEVLEFPIEFRGQEALLNIVRASRRATDSVGPALGDAGRHPLTSLPSRAILLDRLHRAFGRASRHGEQLAVILLDLDALGEINEKYGQEVGDKVVRVAAQRLRSCVRPTDTVAHFADDSFSVLLENVTAPMRVALVAERILASVGAPFELGESSLSCSASVGVAYFVDSHGTPDDLIRDAQSALQRAKASGKGRFEIFGLAGA